MHIENITQIYVVDVVYNLLSFDIKQNLITDGPIGAILRTLVDSKF